MFFLVAKRGRNKIALRTNRKMQFATTTRTVCFHFVLMTFFNFSSFGFAKLSFFIFICFLSIMAPWPRKTTRRTRNAKMRHAGGAECLRARNFASRSSSSPISKWARCCLQAARAATLDFELCRASGESCHTCFWFVLAGGKICRTCLWFVLADGESCRIDF